MLPEDKSIRFLIGNDRILDQMPFVKSLPIFDESVLCFLDELSKRLLGDVSLRAHSDIVAFAFWIRRRNLENIRLDYKKDVLRLGRGIAFHVAPSNIPIQFAVSLVYGLLSGNINVVRLSDKVFEEADILCNVINGILEKESFEALRAYICVIRYGHDDRVTEYLSSICDARLIWGGDNTVHSIKKFETPTRAVELCFADRDSIAIIDSEKYLEAEHDILARDFYIDTYYVDQNACSSPRIVLWKGNKVDEAKEIFWGALAKEIKDYDLSPVAGSEKLLQYCLLAGEHGNIVRIADGNKLVRVELDNLYENVLDYKSGMGYFFEYTIQDLSEIVPLLRKSCQTVSYYGIDPADIRNLVKENGVRGVDRIVLMGHSQELSLIWDGFDIIDSLSRIISCR